MTPFKISIVAIVLFMSVGITANQAAAARVVSWELGDFNGDGLMSDWTFFTEPTGDSLFAFAPFGEVGCFNAEDGDTCDAIAFDSGSIDNYVFTTYSNFALRPVEPLISGNISADITNGDLSFTALDWAFTFFTNLTLTPPDDINAVLVETLTDLGGGEFGVVVRFISTINNQASAFDTFEANWRLEGVMTTVPIPAAAWLFGSGLLGMLSLSRRKL